MSRGGEDGPVVGDQRATPLAEALIAYRRGGIASFHTPGHKLGAGAPSGLVEAVGLRFLEADMGIANGVDDTQLSGGFLGEAEQLAAAAWGADAAFFLVNGSTSGVQALVAAVAGPGETVIVPRNAHKSLLAGLIFSGAMPVYVEPTVDPDWGIAVNVPAARVLAAIEAHPEARAVLLTTPSYHGFCADVRGLAAPVHDAGMLLVADQAWGAHLRFCSALPEDGLSAGADAAVVSVHKLLSGLSQASVVLARRGRLDLHELRTLVAMAQTTSPLAPILVSIDLARAQMVQDGEALWRGALDLCREARDRIAAIPGMAVLDPLGRAAWAGDFDPVRLTVSAAELGCSGFALERLLREECRVAVEAADPLNVVLNITFADTPETVDRLVAALELVAGLLPATPARRGAAAARVALALVPSGSGRQVLTPREAFFGPSRPVPLAACAGRISAEMVVPYPPGIPVLGPGEEISPEVVAYLEEARAQDLHVHGPRDLSLTMLRVVV